MKLELFRYNSDIDHTNGVFLTDGVYECDTLEDEYRRWKVKHETRIPDGNYKITFRTVGGFHNSYKNRYGSWHKGMLWLRDVPGFEYILIHAGNTDDDTSGCILVGSAKQNDANYIASSRKAYEKLYPKVRNALLRGEEVRIEVKTLDNVNK